MKKSHGLMLVLSLLPPVITHATAATKEDGREVLAAVQMLYRLDGKWSIANFADTHSEAHCP